MPAAARHRPLADRPERPAVWSLAGDRTLRSWGAAPWRRTPTDPSTAPRLAARRAVAVATSAEEPAAVARVAGDPSRAGVEEVRRMDHLERVVRRSLAVDPRSRRTDSSPRVNRLGNAAALPAQSQVVAEAGPKQRAELAAELLLVAAAGNHHPTGRGAPAAEAARTEALAAEARPTAPVGERRAALRLVRARSAGGDLAEQAPGPLRLAPGRPAARRKRGKTCWWAGWLRHTACRRS